MNEKKLNQLFGAARKKAPPSPETGFDNLVLAAIGREPRNPAGRVTLLDQLGALFPQMAWATALVAVLCVAADFGLGAWGVPSLTDGVGQISEQWLFTASGF